MNIEVVDNALQVLDVFASDLVMFQYDRSNREAKKSELAFAVELGLEGLKQHLNSETSCSVGASFTNIRMARDATITEGGKAELVAFYVDLTLPVISSVLLSEVLLAEILIGTHINSMLWLKEDIKRECKDRKSNSRVGDLSKEELPFSGNNWPLEYISTWLKLKWGISQRRGDLYTIIGIILQHILEPINRKYSSSPLVKNRLVIAIPAYFTLFWQDLRNICYVSQVYGALRSCELPQLSLQDSIIFRFSSSLTVFVNLLAVGVGITARYFLNENGQALGRILHFNTGVHSRIVCISPYNQFNPVPHASGAPPSFTVKLPILKHGRLHDQLGIITHPSCRQGQGIPRYAYGTLSSTLLLEVELWNMVTGECLHFLEAYSLYYVCRRLQIAEIPRPNSLLKLILTMLSNTIEYGESIGLLKFLLELDKLNSDGHNFSVPGDTPFPNPCIFRSLTSYPVVSFQFRNHLTVVLITYEFVDLERLLMKFIEYFSLVKGMECNSEILRRAEWLCNLNSTDSSMKLHSAISFSSYRRTILAKPVFRISCRIACSLFEKVEKSSIQPPLSINSNPNPNLNPKMALLTGPPPTHNPSNLPTLPTELLMQISSYLPRSSIACLAFTTRRIYSDMDSSAFSKVQAGRRLAYKKDYIRLLRLLERDREAEGLWYCDFCVSIHESPDHGVPYTNSGRDDAILLTVYAPAHLSSVQVPSTGNRSNGGGVLEKKNEEEGGSVISRVYDLDVTLAGARAMRTPRWKEFCYNVGICISRFRERGRVLLYFPACSGDEGCEGEVDEGEEEEDTGGFEEVGSEIHDLFSDTLSRSSQNPSLEPPPSFTATYFYTAEARVVRIEAQVDANNTTEYQGTTTPATLTSNRESCFIHLTNYKILLSTPLSSPNQPELEPLHNFRQALHCLRIQQCHHYISSSHMHDTILGRLQRMLFGAGAQDSIGGGTGGRDEEGWCECGCLFDVDVRTVGGFGAEVKIYRVLGKKEGLKCADGGVRWLWERGKKRNTELRYRGWEIMFEIVFGEGICRQLTSKSWLRLISIILIRHHGMDIERAYLQFNLHPHSTPFSVLAGMHAIFTLSS
ncbi:uncharacterized protein BDR25DRAFT_347726 [Lindgomyces ingoldianus]|uniref:Uncharacterized protein n=1 Tax=Lindgomyces ingoldianus TaxID=673940 RepID=A0ACB6RDD5_9PLEO|nr:uncharacterized protein BDR25DRAFT_347726 [Lindgomyces ingoldianus]KAF2477349.1 hypothetical protein BDR25DRAFT_347726 [Lindgomyces ingoldianus]